MDVYEMLLLKKVPKLNFTVSHILVSYPLIHKSTYNIEDTEFRVYYLYTHARSETFPMIILSETPIAHHCPPAGPAWFEASAKVYVHEGPFRLTIKNVPSKKFWWFYNDKEIHDRVEVIIRKGKGNIENLGERATKLVISGSENYVMTHTFRQYYTEFKDREGDLVLLKASTGRRFSNDVNVFITRRTIEEILNNAEPPRYIAPPAQKRMGARDKVMKPTIVKD